MVWGRRNSGKKVGKVVRAFRVAAVWVVSLLSDRVVMTIADSSK